MSLIVRLLLFACLVCFHPAGAEEMSTGGGVVCDTEAQLEAVIKNKHVNVHAAIAEVNAGTNACGYLNIVYLRGRKVGEVPVSSGIYDLTEITVIGVYEDGWRVVTPTKQFTAFFRPGQRT